MRFFAVFQSKPVFRSHREVSGVKIITDDGWNNCILLNTDKKEVIKYIESLITKRQIDYDQDLYAVEIEFEHSDLGHLIMCALGKDRSYTLVAARVIDVHKINVRWEIDLELIDEY